jgi:hypothetical protein
VREEDQAQDKGRAAVIQDIDAPPHICMEKILDFVNYPKYVSFLKKLEIYRQEKDTEGNQITSALFDAGLLTLHVGYYLRIVVRPRMSTLTWTLDYSRKSDFGLFFASPLPSPRLSVCLTHSTSQRIISAIGRSCRTRQTGESPSLVSVSS